MRLDDLPPAMLAPIGEPRAADAPHAPLAEDTDAARPAIDAQPSVFDPIDTDALALALMPDLPPAVAAPLPVAEPEADKRVSVRRLDRLLRRAGRALSRGGRIEEHLARAEQQLAQLETRQGAIEQRLAELQRAVERQQAVLLQGPSADAADPQAADRAEHLRALASFVAQLADDQRGLARVAHDETRQAAALLREHTQQLKEQQRELLQVRLVP